MLLYFKFPRPTFFVLWVFLLIIIQYYFIWNHLFLSPWCVMFSSLCIVPILKWFSVCFTVCHSCYRLLNISSSPAGFFYLSGNSESWSGSWWVQLVSFALPGESVGVSMQNVQRRLSQAPALKMNTWLPLFWKLCRHGGWGQGQVEGLKINK